MKEKMMVIAALAAVVAIVVLSVPSQETEADATNPFTVVDGSDYASLNDAITNVPDNGTIEVNTSTSIAGTTINATKAFTLDLNGNTITTSGTLTVGSGTTLTIESSVEGGAILASGATIINLNGGTLNILSGTIDRAEGNTSTNVTAVLFTSGTLTIGTQDSDVGPHLAKIQPKGKDVAAYSGIVEGALYTTFGDGSVLQCFFENSPNSRIPENMVTTYDEDTGYWTVQPYTIGSATGAQASITHADGTVTYYSSAFYAASEMGEGETLTLLADYVGDGAITFPIHYGTLDLGTYSITNTWSTGTAVETKHSQYDRNPDPTKPFVITGEATATIVGSTPVGLSAGNSDNRLLFSLQGEVSLVSSTGDECIDIGTGSYLVYSESILKYVTGTAFKATVDDVELIYGTAGSAIRDSDDAYALMLNDCNEGINLVPDDGRMWTLDLGGHIVSSSTTNGTIDIGVSDAKVTIRHGTVEGTYNGIFIGIPPGNGTVYNNIEVIIEDVVIEVTGDYADDINNITYGINTNGISTGIEVTLKNSTVECTNGMGIYFPADGALTLEDSKVKGLSGIELRRGTLEISGKSSVEAYSKTYSVSGNSGGPNMTGAAIAVIPYGSTEASVIGVSISGNGTFTGPVAFAVDNALDVDNLSYDFSVSGGKFTSTGNDDSGQAYSAIEIEAGEISERFITGGTFSSGTTTDESVGEYVDSAYKVGDDGTVVPNPDTYVVENGDRYYISLQAAVEDAADGDTIVMTVDELTLAGTLTVPKGITIDLGGGTLILAADGDSPGGIKFTSGESTIRNGTIQDPRSDGNTSSGLHTVEVSGKGTILNVSNVDFEVTVPQSSSYNYALFISGGSTLKLDGSSISEVDQTGESWFDRTSGVTGVAVLGPGPNAGYVTTLAVTDTTIETRGFAVAGSGNETSYGTSITLGQGTVINTVYAAVYHPQDGELVVDGASITGRTGIEIRAGSLEIRESSSVTSTGHFTSTPNGSGVTSIGAAVAVVQHTTKQPIDVTITGGTFQGERAFFECNTQGNEPLEGIKIEISGGTFIGTNGGLSVECLDIGTIGPFITGGTFNTDVIAYMPTGMGIVTNPDGSVTVTAPVRFDVDSITVYSDSFRLPVTIAEGATVAYQLPEGFTIEGDLVTIPDSFSGDTFTITATSTVGETEYLATLTVKAGDAHIDSEDPGVELIIVSSAESMGEFMERYNEMVGVPDAVSTDSNWRVIDVSRVDGLTDPVPFSITVPGLSETDGVAFYAAHFGITVDNPECVIEGDRLIITPSSFSTFAIVPYLVSVDPDPEPTPDPDDPGVLIPPTDDDDYVPPIYVPSDTSSSDDDTVKIVACAAAAVVAAIMAAFLILGHRRE